MSDAALTVSATEKNTYKKVVISGDVIEVYEMERKPASGGRSGRDLGESETIRELREFLGLTNGKEWIEDYSLDKSMSDTDKLLRKFWEHEDDRKREVRSIARTRNMVRRLVLSNFDAGSKFVTFTFAENVKDIGQANKEWDKFIKRLRRCCGAFKYLAVIEFQKRGAIHYHMISDLPYVKKRELAEMWGQGYVHINRIQHVDNVGAYVIKYMTKDLYDERLCGKKAYQCSKGLVKPDEIRGAEAEEIIARYGLEAKKEVYGNSYISEHHGLISYREYNLKRQL